MNLTNHSGLPPSLVHAITFDERDRGGCDYTITELLTPPRISALRRKHASEITEDASERIWALLGSAGHEVLRRSAKAQGIGMTEERAIVEIGGFKVGGQLDYALSDDKCLRDFKFTSVWAVKDGVKIEYEQQLNCYNFLAAQYGVHFERLEIIALLRDWSKPEAMRNRDYPPVGVVVLPVKLWTLPDTESFILGRIALHERAKVELPECTPDECWERPEKWAVKKKGNVRATKLFDSHPEAQAFAATDSRFEVEHRPGERVRCAAYCPASEFCFQYQAWSAKNGGAKC